MSGPELRRGNEAQAARGAAAKACDLVILGSGAAGLTCALAAHANGLSPVVIEKTAVIGGSTALSEGMIWIPGSRQQQALAADDSRARDDAQAALAYLEAAGAGRADLARARAYLAVAPAALALVEDSCGIRFRLNRASMDYHPELPGATRGLRALNPPVFDGRALGREGFALLRRPLDSMMLFGGMSIASSDLPDYYRVLSSPAAATRIAGHVARHVRDRLSGYARGTRIANGNGLVAALLAALRARGVPILTQRLVTRLDSENGRVSGVILRGPNGEEAIAARRGVVLATGGFSRSAQATRAHFPHAGDGLAHLALPPEGSDGDALALAGDLGARTVSDLTAPALWTPASRVPTASGPSLWPHFGDRAKPGVIAVDDRGLRFANEATTYLAFGAAMIANRAKAGSAGAWLIADHAALRRYGLGAVGPSPMRLAPFLRSGYLRRAGTPRDLARGLGLPEAEFSQTLARFNANASAGTDPDFGRGLSPYERGNGDPSAAHPNLRPLTEPPFYAIRMEPGDIGTFVGLAVDPQARVLGANDEPIPGLFAAGNAAATMTGGAYPAAGLTIGAAMVFGFIAARAAAGANDETPAGWPATTTGDGT